VDYEYNFQDNDDYNHCERAGNERKGDNKLEEGVENLFGRGPRALNDYLGCMNREFALGV